MTKDEFTASRKQLCPAETLTASQQAFAALLFVSLSHVRHMERGHRQIPAWVQGIIRLREQEQACKGKK